MNVNFLYFMHQKYFSNEFTYDTSTVRKAELFFVWESSLCSPQKWFSEFNVTWSQANEKWMTTTKRTTPLPLHENGVHDFFCCQVILYSIPLFLLRLFQTIFTTVCPQLSSILSNQLWIMLYSLLVNENEVLTLRTKWNQCNANYRSIEHYVRRFIVRYATHGLCAHFMLFCYCRLTFVRNVMHEISVSKQNIFVIIFVCFQHLFLNVFHLQLKFQRSTIEFEYIIWLLISLFVSWHIITVNEIFFDMFYSLRRFRGMIVQFFTHSKMWTLNSTNTYKRFLPRHIDWIKTETVGTIFFRNINSGEAVKKLTRQSISIKIDSGVGYVNIQKSKCFLSSYFTFYNIFVAFESYLRTLFTNHFQPLSIQ